MMSNRIIDVLAPYEDEVLVSWVVRMLRMYKINKLDSHTDEIMRDLFGPTTSDKPGLYLQRGLQYFCENCGIKDSTLYASEKTMYEAMSVLPFYLQFCPDEYKKTIENNISDTSYYIYTEAKLGIRYDSKYLEGQGYYKFCPECIKSQREYYLKKEHQIQGNLVCWEHGCVLHRLPYSLRWKDIDFIAKLETDTDISDFVLSEEEREIAHRISMLIHEIFENGFLDDVKILKAKIIQKMLDDGILSAKGFFNKWKTFANSLGANYLYSDSDLKRDVIMAIDSKEQWHVNPIIYLFLIRCLFGSLENYYDYEINDSTYQIPQNVKFFEQHKIEEKHEIDYYEQNTEGTFFKEYSILGDTEDSIVVNHEVCGTTYTVTKKSPKLRKCRFCKVNKIYADGTCMHNRDKIRYCRYVNTIEFAHIHGKKRMQIRNYCSQNRIPGAIRVGKDILVPIDAPYPEYKRSKKHKE